MNELYKAFESIAKEEVLEEKKMTGSGSNRQYFRLSGKKTSLIGVIGESVEENKAFLNLTKHFNTKDLPVPQVYFVSADFSQYLQQDLGNVSLFDYIKSGRDTGSFSEAEIMMLKKTIKQLVKMQFEGALDLDFSLCYPQSEFNKRTVLWDLNYFKYYFLKPSGIDFNEDKLESDFEKIVDVLLQHQTNTFLYRDFQSRNVMIHDNEPYFIDYQGGRRGPVFYDLASFLWQAKANFPNELRKQLLQVYLDESKKYLSIDVSVFHSQLKHFVLFRTLQVLGAYGYRGFFEKKTHFIESVPFAIKNLQDLLTDDFSDYPYLVKVLRQMCESQQEKQAVKKNEKLPLEILVYSFSYKKGIPQDESGNGGGYVFDCRAIHNPGRYEEYKNLTGLDQPVIDFLEKDGEITPFLEKIYFLADQHIQRYLDRGFSHLMFAFGCTGGQHRSVYSAQHLAQYISEKFGVKVKLTHREQEIYTTFND